MCRVWEGFLVQYVVTAVCSFALRAYGVAGGSLNGAYSCCEERTHFLGSEESCPWTGYFVLSRTSQVRYGGMKLFEFR
jgi:hypothetical protein